MNDIVKAVATFVIIIILTSTVHWSLHVLYTMWCAPHNLKGMINTFITLGSPLCQFINFVQFELAKHYITIWTAAGLAIIGYITTKLVVK